MKDQSCGLIRPFDLSAGTLKNPSAWIMIGSYLLLFLYKKRNENVLWQLPLSWTWMGCFSAVFAINRRLLCLWAGVEIFLLVIAPFPLYGVSWKATRFGDLFAIGIQSFWHNPKKWEAAGSSVEEWEFRGTILVETRFLNSWSLFLHLWLGTGKVNSVLSSR